MAGSEVGCCEVCDGSAEVGVELLEGERAGVLADVGDVPGCGADFPAGLCLELFRCQLG